MKTTTSGDDHVDPSVDDLSPVELVKASGDPVALLAEKLATVMTDEQWENCKPFLEDVFEKYYHLISASEMSI